MTYDRSLFPITAGMLVFHVLAALGAAPVAGAQDTFEPRLLPTLHVTRAQGTIQIDGELDDPGWRGAARADGFAEVSPGDQVRPPVESEALVTYDDTHFYVALIAHDDPSTIRVSLRDRDEIFSDDYFGVMIDTYGDLTFGYELFVNPIGVQGDLRLDASGSEDGAFDMIWESRGKVTGTGYQVELAIPFASLRFPDRPTQKWRFNLWRDHQREVRRRYAWAAQDRDNPCFMCQWGTLTGIENIQPGANIEVIGTVIGSQSGGVADADDPSAPFENDDPTGEAALNIRYGLTSNASTELAINPDFSQVESDAGQIDVNNPFALFFPERRPFFQEGSDLYNTWVSAIYTRSINDPVVAGKLAGQFGRTSLVYTFARDERSPMILPFEERSRFLALDESTSNILRARQTLFEDSSVGVLLTDRRLDGEGAGTVFGGDATVRFLQNYRVEFQALASHTEEPNDTTLTDGLNGTTFDEGAHTVDFDGEKYWGRAVYLSLERSARVWNADIDYWEYTPTFRTDNGFTTRNDYKQLSLWSGTFFRPNGAWLINWEPSVGVGRIWSHAGRFKDEWVRPHLYFRLKGQTDVNIEHLISRERFSSGVFPGIRITFVGVDSRFSEMLTGGASARWGRGIFRSFSDPELGEQLNLSAYAGFKPMQRLTIQPSWNYARMDSRISETRLFEGYILRTRVNYNFTREWSSRLVIQYNEFARRFDLEPLLTYRLNPFTVFFLGSASQHHSLDSGELPGATADAWRMTSRQFFTKLQYLYRF